MNLYKIEIVDIGKGVQIIPELLAKNIGGVKSGYGWNDENIAFIFAENDGALYGIIKKRVGEFKEILFEDLQETVDDILNREIKEEDYQYTEKGYDPRSK